MLVLALQRGHLEVVTEPVHRFLLVDGHVRPELRKKYAQDLRERWLLETEILERHQESRRFMGPLVGFCVPGGLRGARGGSRGSMRLEKDPTSRPNMGLRDPRRSR